MDRRSFLKSVGVTAAGTAVAASSDSFAAGPTPGLPPLFFSNGNRDRRRITSTDLTPWSPSSSQPWDVHTINHLYRRAGFGATLAEIAAASGKTPSQVVDALLDDNLLKGNKLPADPQNSDKWLHVPPYLGTDLGQQIAQQSLYYSANMDIRTQWTVLMNQPDVMLREKMSLFWMNHFVIEATKKVYYPQMVYNFLSYFRQNAWGNFKKMVSDVTVSPAMLIYLDGIYNQGLAPNENYARELQELFTLGVVDKDGKANYTQADVEGVAHALTGWTVDATAPAPNVLPAKYDVNRHDSSFQKIYDGVNRQYNLTASGASMDMDLIDHIFDQRGDQIAWYICSKLYQFFVYHDITQKPEKDIIDAMAATFKQGNWELKPVLSQLLKSAHFFDEANIGAGIKSPYEHLLGMIRTFTIQIDINASTSLYYYALAGSQELLDPPNVKGWPGYHSWISTTTLPYRNSVQTLLISGAMPGIGGGTPVNLPADMLGWSKQLASYDSGTFDEVINELANYLCAHLPSATAIKYVKSPFPAGYEWGILTDQVKVGTIRTLINRIMLLADYQLS